MDKEKDGSSSQSTDKKNRKVPNFGESQAAGSRNSMRRTQESAGGSDHSIQSTGSEGSDRESLSEEGGKQRPPLAKGHENINITKPVLSMFQRPLSPPPPANKIEKLKVVKSLPLEKKTKTKHKGKKSGNDNDEDDDSEEVEDDEYDENYERFSPGPSFSPNIFVNFFEDQTDDDDDDDEDIFIVHNPSGSVLAPVANPYNKQERIRQANIDLFSEAISTENSDDIPRIKFNENVCLLDAENVAPSPASSTSQDSHSHEQEKEIAIVHCDSSGIPSHFEKSKEKKSHSDGKEHFDAKNGIPDGLNVKSNPKVLLVMVPKTVHDSVCLHSDNSSSSENEDVCIGHSVVKKVDNVKSEGISDEILSQTEKENNYKKDESLVETSIFGQGDGKELVANLNLIPSTISDVFNDCNGGGDTCYGPENRTGIQIKITCPSCSDILNCVDLCETDYESNLCGINENSKCSPHSCSTRLGDEESELTKHKTNTVLKPKNNQRNKQYGLPNSKNQSVKSDDSLLKKNSHTVKDNINSLAINLTTKSDSNNSLKTKPSTKSKSCKEKLKKNYVDKIAVNKNSVAENKSSESVSQTKKYQLIKNKMDQDTVVIENDKENEKQLDENNQQLVKHGTITSLDQLKTNTTKKCSLKKDANGSKQKKRPKSCSERQNKLQYSIKRPGTAPVSTRRGCCTGDLSRLPEYNGFRSEYGLSEEQLQERKRIIIK